MTKFFTQKVKKIFIEEYIFSMPYDHFTTKIAQFRFEILTKKMKKKARL